MKIWGLQQVTKEEREDILSKHRELYNGYQSMQPKVPSEQPLYVQDFAKDKAGAVMSNKGVVKGYTNVGINENKKEMMCSECGGMMSEGECMECGWKGEVGAMEEDECMECGSKMEEGTGHLDDIYDVEDLGSNEFDYVEGGGNKYGTFEKMHHMRGIKNEQVKENYEDPDNEDDGFEDLQADGGEMYEQGYTGGGNAPDMDLSNIEPAYDFVSDGPMAGGDVYPTEGELEEDHMDSYEPMESAWKDDELDEYNDISGVQGVYGDMKPAYDFDSKGPGSAGPYQTSSFGGGYEGEDEDAYWQEDLAPDELELDLTKFNPEDKSWTEITDYTGEDEFAHMDEEIKESFIEQKNKIQEMFQRMKNYN